MEIFSSIWVKIILLILVIGGIVFLFDYSMRKVFNLKKEKNPDRYINDLHKRINIWLIVIFIGLVFLGIVINAIREPFEPIYLLEPQILVFEFIFVRQLVKIFIEWKHINNPNVYLFSIAELIFYFMLLLVGYKYFILDNILNLPM